MNYGIEWNQKEYGEGINEIYGGVEWLGVKYTMECKQNEMKWARTDWDIKHTVMSKFRNGMQNAIQWDGLFH